MQPADFNSGGCDFNNLDDRLVQKDAVRAFIAHVHTLENSHSAAEILKAKLDLHALVPDLKRMGFFEVFNTKSKLVKELIREADSSL